MEASKVRVRRSVAEKRRIFELTFQPGQSVARVALAEGVNSHQVFQWRRTYVSVRPNHVDSSRVIVVG